MLLQILGNDHIIKLIFWKLKASRLFLKPDFANRILKTFHDGRDFYSKWEMAFTYTYFFTHPGEKKWSQYLWEGLILRQNKTILGNIDIADFYYTLNSLYSVSKTLSQSLFCFATISLWIQNKVALEFKETSNVDYNVCTEIHVCMTKYLSCYNPS